MLTSHSCCSLIPSWSSYILNLLESNMTQNKINSWSNKNNRSKVIILLLNELNLNILRETLQFVSNLFIRERSNLLQSNNGYIILSLISLSLGLQIKINLPSANEHLFNLLLILGVLRANDLLEQAWTEEILLDRVYYRMLKKFLWTENNQRLSESSMNLIS